MRLLGQKKRNVLFTAIAIARISVFGLVSEPKFPFEDTNHQSGDTCT
jgi:hypothetical protein